MWSLLLSNKSKMLCSFVSPLPFHTAVSLKSLRFVTVCYGLLRFVTVCYDLLRFVTVCYGLLRYFANTAVLCANISSTNHRTAEPQLRRTANRYPSYPQAREQDTTKHETRFVGAQITSACVICLDAHLEPWWALRSETARGSMGGNW